MASPTIAQTAPAYSVLHHVLPDQISQGNSYVWESLPVHPFNEALISWNASRPTQGEYHLYTSVRINEWTPWLKYATWAADGQRSYSAETEDKCVRVFQDTLDVKDQARATQIRVKIEAARGAFLQGVKAFHIGLANLPGSFQGGTGEDLKSIRLSVLGISQMALPHPRNKHLCSPTSTTAWVRSLEPGSSLRAEEFADKVWDGGHDIYGNWVFNTAQAFVELRERFWVWVQRLNDFGSIVGSLEQGIPVVVSVKGPLKGSPIHYEGGHLMLVYGLDVQAGKVLCMDPAYSKDGDTLTEYVLSDFLEAWNRRGRVAYLARPVSS